MNFYNKPSRLSVPSAFFKHGINIAIIALFLIALFFLVSSVSDTGRTVVEEPAIGSETVVTPIGKDFVPVVPEKNVITPVTPSETIAVSGDGILQRGVSSPEVKELQEFLNESGFFLATEGYGSPGFETEYFGPLTEQALKNYQSQRELLPSGVVDEQTSIVIESIKENSIRALSGYESPVLSGGIETTGGGQTINSLQEEIVLAQDLLVKIEELQSLLAQLENGKIVIGESVVNNYVGIEELNISAPIPLPIQVQRSGNMPSRFYAPALPTGN